METNGFCVVVERDRTVTHKAVETRREAFLLALAEMGRATADNVDCTARVFRARDGQPDRTQPMQVHATRRRPN